jgi:hypothetical protein
VSRRLEERKAHRAADQHGVGPVQERLEHADLVRHLGAADHGHERPLRVLEDAGQRRHLALQQPPRRAGQQVGDRLGGGVRAVRRAERVVDVDVGQRGVPLRQLRVVLGLPVEEAHVLDHHDLGVRHLIEVRRQLHVDPEQLAQPAGGRLERELRVAALRPPEMGEQHELPRPLLAELAQRRQRSLDPGVVGDLARVVQWNVEVDADENPLALDVQVVKRAHARAPSGRARRSGSSSPTHCRTRR